MIVISLQMWPNGMSDKAYDLGRAYIWNDGSGTTKRRNYQIRVCRRGKHTFHDALNSPTRTGALKKFPSESYNVWRLIVRALKECFPEEG